ncbi:MAG: hypothetical protein AAF708_14820, partial [Deinococcota bacterium]
LREDSTIHVVHASNDTVMLGTSTGLAISLDAGATWNVTGLQTSGTSNSNNISAVFADEGNLYAGVKGTGSLFRSRDNGALWQQLNVPASGAAASESDAYQIYAQGTTLAYTTTTLRSENFSDWLDVYISYSFDDGQSWTVPFEVSPRRDQGWPGVDHLVKDNTIYTVDSLQGYISQDGSSLSFGPLAANNTQIGSFAIDGFRHDDGVMYALPQVWASSGYEQAFQSLDQGKTWTRVTDLELDQTPSPYQIEAGMVYVLNGDGTIQHRVTGLESRHVHDFETYQNYIFAATDTGLYITTDERLSDDGSTRWLGLFDGTVTGIVFDPEQQLLFAMTPEGLYYAKDVLPSLNSDFSGWQGTWGWGRIVSEDSRDTRTPFELRCAICILIQRVGVWPSSLGQT